VDGLDGSGVVDVLKVFSRDGEVETHPNLRRGEWGSGAKTPKVARERAIRHCG